ncbi:hypothetical protein BST41_30370 [Mycolicibacterium porcinum]|nr:hypothetical protein BST41_30370 [Mycolicibacterium porcinum]
MPAEWAAAVAAVTRDLGCRRNGRAVSLESVEWTLAVFSDGSVAIGFATTADDADLSAFSVGRGFALEATCAQAMVWVASVVQDELAGYEFVQWPSDGSRLYAPDLIDGTAVWVDHAGRVIAPIGALCRR